MTKKKIIILIIAVSFAVFAGVLAVVDVFANTQQNVKNPFNITVNANNVDVNFMFSTRDEKGNIQQFPKQKEEEDIYYSISSTQSDETVYNLDEIILGDDNTCLILVFNIFNCSNKLGDKIKVTFLDNIKKENVRCYYSFNSGADFECLKDEKNLELPEERELLPQEEYVLYMAIEIIDPTINVSFEGAKISFILE